MLGYSWPKTPGKSLRPGSSRVWICPRDWDWQTVRAEVQVKETYFDPLVERRSLSRAPGGGRKLLAEEAARRITSIRQKCSEDFDALARRLEAAM